MSRSHADAHLHGDAHTDAYSDPHVHVDTYSDAYSDPHEHSDLHADADVHADTDSDPNEYADTHADADVHADTDSDPNEYADTHADAYSDVHAHPYQDADAYSDSHANAHTHPNADADLDARVCSKLCRSSLRKQRLWRELWYVLERYELSRGIRDVRCLMSALRQEPDLEFDPDALRAKYRYERDKRIRPDGNDQYVEAAGEFARFVDDPYVEPGFAREALTDEVDVVLIGGGFGGLLAGARLRQAGARSIRVIEKGGDFGGTWYWNRYPGVACDIESYVYLPLLEEIGYVPREVWFSPD